MSVTLNPAIEGLDPESLCYRVYSHLYHNFFYAQDRKDEAHPWGVEEGDETSIRLRNTAYGFAEVIAAAGSGGSAGGPGGELLDYLKKTGGYMTGHLNANYGFQAGIGNTGILSAFRDEIRDETGQRISEIFGIRINGNLEIGEKNFFIGGKQLLSYVSKTDTAYISSGKIDFGGSALFSTGEMIFGDNAQKGVFISPEILLIKGNEVFHRGNASLSSIDWTMRDGIVEGNLSVAGKAAFSGLLRALQGVELGMDNEVYISMDKDNILAGRFLSFAKGYGIKIEDHPVLVRTGEKDISLGAIGGSLILGNTLTDKIRICSNVFDRDGDYMLLSENGAAYFPDSLTVRHSFGDVLFSSYRKDHQDEGMIIHKKLRFSSQNGSFICGKDDGITFSCFVENISPDERKVFAFETLFKNVPSSSCYKPLDRFSSSFFLETEADFFVFNKPLEARGHIGIDGSSTRLTGGRLFFTDGQYLLSSADGIKHSGNAYFLENISSERFSSGFAGSGWGIIQNRTTGNMAATFDELTIRRKMRIYELEVEKTGATNGALWITDSSSGDTVIKL